MADATEHDDSYPETAEGLRQRFSQRRSQAAEDTSDEQTADMRVNRQGTIDPTRQSRAAQPAGKDDFTGAPVPLQVKIPTDMVQSLKLHAIAGDKTMSELVLECLTSNTSITKAWISTRRAA